MNPKSSFHRSTPAKLSRRDFLALVWKGLLALSGALGLIGLARFLGYQSEPTPPSRFDLGPPETYPPDSVTLLPHARAVLFRKGNEFRALSLVCTHLGCTVELQANGFACPCHGSRFDLEGQVRQGPANQPLRTLRLEVNAQGHLSLSTD